MSFDNNVIPPKNRKWYFYGRSKNKFKRVKSDNIKFLVLIALETKVTVARKLVILPFIREISPYTTKNKYFEFQVKIM
jgi:hypothetical protein